MLKKKISVFLIILFVFFLDLITKNYAVSSLIINHSISINNFFNLTLAFNYGAAFSFLSDAGGWQRWFFISFTSIIILVLSYMIVKDKDNEYIALSFILAGALGNLYDRLFLGYVIDFIEIHYGNFYWPIFNIADISISIGVILLLYTTFINRKKSI